MNIKSSFKYQIKESARATAIYYIIISIIYVLSIATTSIALTSDSGAVNATMSGMEMTSIIFLFVLGLNTFKEDFFMMLQNGVSRKSMFKARLLVGVTIAAIVSIADNILRIICSIIYSHIHNVDFISLYELLYNNKNGQLSITIGSLSFCFGIYLFIFAFGYIVTVLYYKMNKLQKIVVSVGVPVFIVVIIPLFEEYVTLGAISSLFYKFMDLSLGLSTASVINALISGIIGFVVLSGIAWIMIRKTVAK